MYDYKCPTDEYFYNEDKINYSVIQKGIYELFRKHRINIIHIPNRRYGASMILNGIAKACCLAGINVCILAENEEIKSILQQTHTHILGCDLNLTITVFRDFKWSSDVILLDNFDSLCNCEELKKFLDQAIAGDFHVLATGRLEDHEKGRMITSYPMANFATFV
jgi:hypothetical protein